MSVTRAALYELFVFKLWRTLGLWREGRNGRLLPLKTVNCFRKTKPVGTKDVNPIIKSVCA